MDGIVGLTIMNIPDVISKSATSEAAFHVYRR